MNKTGIPYLDRAWNPVRGCSHCGPACDNCYAEDVAKRFCHEQHQRNDLNLNTSKIIPAGPYSGFATTSGWTGRVELVPEKLVEPLRSRKPQRVGVCFTSDLFHEALSDTDVLSVFQQIGKSPRHTFVILTKRWERMQEFLSIRRWRNLGHSAAMGRAHHVAIIPGEHLETDAAFLPNVWLGVSAWDQPSLDAAAGCLLRTRAAVRWLSYEPALGYVDVGAHLHKTKWDLTSCMSGYGPAEIRVPPIDWVVAGCESGPKRRSANIRWFRDLRDQCVAAEVPFYLKQMEVDGRVVEHPELDGRVWRELPDGENVA